MHVYTGDLTPPAATKGAGIPYVAVLAATNSDLRFDPLVTAGAMFGDLASQVRLGVPTSSATVTTVFGGGGRLQPKQFRGVSAVALVEWFNPTQSRLDAVLEERFSGVPEWRASMSKDEITDATAQIIRIDVDTRAELIARGEYDPDALRTKMTVLHNPHADLPLGFDVLDASDDRQWCAIETPAGLGYGERVPAPRLILPSSPQ